jgi:hypothetical protein
MAKGRLTWINTAGGPHLLVAEKHAAHWKGVAEPSNVRAVQACDNSGWLGVIRVGRGRGVVLTGDVNAAAHYEWQGRHFILRWVYAPSESALLARFREVVAGLAVVEEVSLRHPGGNLFLMDAYDTPQSWLGEHAAFELPGGLYRVTAVESAADKVSFIAHEWQAVRS